MEKLIKFDFMSPKVGFTIDRNETYKTYIGFSLTVVYILLIALAFFAFGRDIFEKRKPSVVYNKDTTKSSIYTFNSSNLVFTLYDGNSQEPIIDIERKLFFYWELFYNYPGGYDTYTYYFSKCSNSTLDYFNETLTIDRSNYYCLNEGSSIVARGSRSDKYFYSSRIQVDYCENEKFNKTDCLPIPEIKKQLPLRISMAFNIDDFYINSLLRDPIVKKIFQTSINSSVENWGRIIFDMIMVDFTSDNGWIIESNSIFFSSTIDKVSFSNMGIPGTKTLFSHQFLNSSWSNLYKRNYVKVQQIFANIGGIIAIIEIILRIICNYLVDPDLQRIFYNQLNQSKTSNHEKINLTLEKTNTNPTKGDNFINNNNNLKDNNIKNDTNLDDISVAFSKNSDLSKTKMKNNLIYISDLKSKSSKRKEKILYQNKTTNIMENNDLKMNNELNKYHSEKRNVVLPLESFKQTHERMTLKINEDHKIKRLLDFEFEDFSFLEKVFRSIICSDNFKIKMSKYEKVKEIFSESFSIEYSANNYRKLEIMRFLLFDEIQNKIIENLDLPELNYYFDFDFEASKNKILNQNNNNESLIDFKLKMLVK